MKNKYRTWIATKLARLRLSNNLEQKDIAAQIEMKAGTYASYEEGRAEPSIFTLERICEVLKITLDQFMSDSPHKEKRTPF